MRYLTKFTIVFGALFFILALGNVPANAQDTTDRKAIILVMDYVDTSDIVEAYTPNIDKLSNCSGTGLMNIRAKNRNPSSSYMSLAVGLRVGTISHSELSFNINEQVKEIPPVFVSQNSQTKAAQLYTLFTGNSAPDNGVVNLYVEPIKLNAQRYNPSYEIGQLGKIAREKGFKVAVLGNADTRTLIDRNIALLAMDETGIVPLGNVGKDLLESSPLTLGGLRTNHQALLTGLQQCLNNADIVIVDLGDTSRIEKSSTNASDEILYLQRKHAVERNDVLLGKIMANIDMNNTMLMIVVPNPSKKMVQENNFGLTPVLVYYPDGEKGLLTSPTTRRMGLVSNTDFLPSLFTYLDNTISSANTGMIVQNSNDNSFRLLDQQLNLFKQLRQTRTPLHNTFMLLAFFTILGGYLVFQKKIDKLRPYLRLLIFTTLSIPLVFLFISFTNYTSKSGSIIITLLAALFTGILVFKLFKDSTNGILFLTGLTALILIADIFQGSPLMLLSPLGSDAIAGGRYYGIGNDFMGILLACGVISSTLIVNKLNLKPLYKAIIGGIPLLIITIAIGHPNYGANVGGLITSLVTTGIFGFIISEHRLSLKKIILIGVIAVAGVIIVAQLDAFFSSTPSHAGKTINNLLTGGFGVFYSIIRTKLGILANTVYNSNWSFILLLSYLILYISWRTARSSFLKIATKLPVISKLIRVLLISSITVFIVNDTGVIAAAFIALYLISCLWLAREEVEEFR